MYSGTSLTAPKNGVRQESKANRWKAFTEMNHEHVETLAIAVLSTLEGLPEEAFWDIVKLAESMGDKRLAEFHEEYNHATLYNN